MQIQKPFYFLRHGQTDWNKADRIQGHVDVPLNETGRVQAEGARQCLRDTGISAICCSPLQRAVETAQIINTALNCPITLIDDLKECGFGHAEGKQVGGLAYENLLRSAAQSGGEAFDDFSDRVMAGIHEALTHSEPVLIVAHGGVFHALKARAGIEYREGLANCTPVYLTPSGILELPISAPKTSPDNRRMC